MRTSTALLLALTVAGCGGGGDSGDAAVAVFKSLGSTQCNTDGTTVATLQNALVNAGVRVIAATCGKDGTAYPTVCGQPDGKIAVFDVALSNQSVAQALGFALLASVPGATRLPCG